MPKITFLCNAPNETYAETNLYRNFMAETGDTYFSMITKIKGKPAGLPFYDGKNKVLGKNYNLTLVFIGDKYSRKLNSLYRNKNYTANVLSFALDKSIGEIYINPRQAARDARLFNESAREFTFRLFIHGLLHLKGYKHGSKIERKEKQLLEIYKI